MIQKKYQFNMAYGIAVGEPVSHLKKKCSLAYMENSFIDIFRVVCRNNDKEM